MKPKCKTEGCEKPVFAKKLCSKCYYEARKEKMAYCKTRGCVNKVKALGLCPSCYQRHLYRRHKGLENVKPNKRRSNYCINEGCKSKEIRCRGLCNACYQKYWKKGLFSKQKRGHNENVEICELREKIQYEPNELDKLLYYMLTLDPEYTRFWLRDDPHADEWWQEDPDYLTAYDDELLEDYKELKNIIKKPNKKRNKKPRPK